MPPDIPSPVTEKRCTKCGEVKSLDQFARKVQRNSRKDRDTRCNACKTEVTRQWREINGDAANAKRVKQMAPIRAARRAVKEATRAAETRRRCKGCRKMKPIAAYRPTPKRSGRQYPKHTCRACESAANKQPHRKAAAKAARERDGQTAFGRLMRLVTCHRHHYKGCNLDRPWAVANAHRFAGVCEYCGTPFSFEPGPALGIPHADAPSLDAIDPTRGHVQGGVAFVHWFCNAGKQLATPEEHYERCLRIVRHMPIRFRSNIEKMIAALVTS